ncbi:MAG: A/G-specific adenine glycosylase [bacterium]
MAGAANKNRTQDKNLQKLLGAVLMHCQKAGRHDLPWRATRDPYKILVSEMMLQQTQVARVIPKYHVFIKVFPDIQALAKAPFPKVLALWSGLGYNRRAKYLHQTAKLITEKYGGKFPKDLIATKLPGVGTYTARAVMAFAYNKPEVFIETNIRTVFTHFCFAEISRFNLDKSSIKVSDSEILPLIEKALVLAQRRGVSPRDFYAALMDYGAHLKQNGVRINNQSKHYTKQSKFAGSARQLRGAILRELLKKPATLAELSKNLTKTLSQANRASVEIKTELTKLQKEGMVVKEGKFYSITQNI